MSFSTLSEVISGAGIVILALLVVAKVYDALKNSDVREALTNLFKVNDPLDIAKTYLKAVEVIFNASIPGSLVYKRLAISLNSSLVVSISIIAEQAANSLGDERKAKTIVGMMLGEKLKKSTRAQIFLGLALFVHLIFVSLLGSNFSSLILLICGVGLIAMHIDHKLIEYRIKKGWYGKNEFESREIIEFILSHANKDDFNDRGGLKKVIPTPEAPEEKSFSTNSGGALA